MSKAAGINESRAQPKSPNDGGGDSNIASLELLQVFFRELLGITPKPSSDYTEEIKALRKRFFGLTKETKTSTFNRFDYEQKYPRDRPGEETEGNARIWLTYLDEAEAFDREKAEGWKETVDVLLVFAGLFSGVITTFVSQASQSLQQDNTQVSAYLLFEISQLLRAQSSGMPIINVPNSTLTPTSPFRPSTNAFLVNGLLFASLAIALSTALFAVLAKQWLYYYLSSIPGTTNEKARARQMRLKGFELWRIGAIIDLLPILLHLALGMFLTGISILLFPLDVRVAWTIIVITGTTYALYFISVILPIVYPECPYTTSLTIYTGALFFFLRGIFGWISVISRKAFHHSEWKSHSRKGNSILKLISPKRMVHSILPLLRYLCDLIPGAFKFHTLVDRIRLRFRRIGELISIKDFPKFTNQWREENIKKAINNAASLDFEALHWLYTTSFNTSIHRIIARCISVHTNLNQKFERDVLRNLGQTLEVNETNIVDLRYGLCLDLLAIENKHWHLLGSMEASQTEEVDYRNYSRIAQDVIYGRYYQILKDASRDDTLEFPLAMWWHFFKRVSVKATMAARILTSEPNGLFEWTFDPAYMYNTEVVSFSDKKLGRWKFAYLFRHFLDGTEPDSGDKSFETRYLLFITIYHDLTSDRPLISNEEQRQQSLIDLFDNFHDWLHSSKPRYFSPEQYLASFRDIFCVDAFWRVSMTNKARFRAVSCLFLIKDLMGTDVTNRFFSTECDDLTSIYQWCSRSLDRYLSWGTTPLIMLLFMPQNRVGLCTILSNDADAVPHFSNCLQNFRNCHCSHIAGKCMFSNLMDLFKSVDPPVPLFTVLYSPSVLVEVWKFHVSYKADAKKFFLVVKSKLDQEKLNDLHAAMTEQAQSDRVRGLDVELIMWFNKRTDIRYALEASTREFGQIIGVSDPQLESTTQNSAPEGATNRDHDTEERAQVPGANERQGPFSIVHRRTKKLFESV